MREKTKTWREKTDLRCKDGEERGSVSKSKDVGLEMKLSLWCMRKMRYIKPLSVYTSVCFQNI